MPLALFSGGVGYAEVLVILAIALIVFGRRLPGVARSLGRSILEFKKGLKDVQDDIEAEPEDESESGNAKADVPPAQNDSNTEKKE